MRKIKSNISFEHISDLKEKLSIDVEKKIQQILNSELLKQKRMSTIKKIFK